MQSKLNLKIKYRESFRPFAPSVLREDAKTYFDLDDESPYMLLVAPVSDSIRRTLSEKENAAMESPDLNDRVQVRRSELPAITHVDCSARIQTVDESRNGKYGRLLQTFKKATGCSALINTSMNVRGEPIVNTPSDALRCFCATEMDTLVIENFILRKESQPRGLIDKYKRHAESFQLD